MHHRAAEYEDGNFECPSCDRLFEHVTPYRGAHVSDDDGSPQPSSPSNAASSSSNRGKGKNSTSTSTSKGRDAMGFEPMSEDSTWVQRSDTDADFPLLPSTKTAALKAILLKGFRDAPRDKVSCPLSSCDLECLTSCETLKVYTVPEAKSQLGCYLRPISSSRTYRRPYLRR